MWHQQIVSLKLEERGLDTIWHPLWWCSCVSYIYRSEASQVNVEKSFPCTMRPGKTLLWMLWI